MNQQSFFSWLINNFSYTQIYFLICLLYLLSLLPIGYFWVKTHLDHVHLIDQQFEELNEETVLKNLFHELQQHRLATQLNYIGNKESFIDMQILENQIRDTLQEARIMSHLVGNDLTHEPSIWLRADPQNIEMRWDSLIKQLPHLTPEESEALHTSIIHDLLIQFGYLSDKVGISYFEEIENYAMIESVFLRLPHLQENLSQLILLSAKDLASHGKYISRDRMSTLINLIESDLTYLRRGQELHAIRFPKVEQSRLLKTLNKYRSSIETLIRTIQGLLLNDQHPNELTLQFQEEAQTAVKTGYELWDEGLKDLKYIFRTERAHVISELWLVLLLTLFLTSLAILLGFALTQSGTRRLTQLREAVDSFTNGNLSVRVPVVYNDEIGQLGDTFNLMAQKLEEIINHLYELLDATKALSNGNLSARIALRESDTEFDQVAKSFNKMAETFEIIISRLQQIGIMLTTSAAEISSASKGQETIIVEQEATTREIAIAANEISATAKELANTMNEVSRVADQTSSLALKGKDSLNNMGSIMTLMVDASSSIAAKLAVLNEKAGSITTVVTTITKVADQTNLLSLNASIEAEKAGEYGRSFAVIAREIRRLADQTAVSTLDIEKIINEIVTAISSSVMGVDDFTQEIKNGVEQVRTVSGQLATIIEQVQALTARFEIVNQGMQAQSTGAEQINEAIAQLSLTAQQTSQAIHQFHRTIEELNNAANELRILSPFLKSLKQEGKSKEVSTEQFEPMSESKFKKTLSNLNIAAKKLKNLNIQFRAQDNISDEPAEPQDEVK